MRLTLPGADARGSGVRRPDDRAEAAFGSAKLVLCLPQPYAKGLPGYAPLGTKIDDLRATLSAGVFTNPALRGQPRLAHGGHAVELERREPNAAATVETQGLVGVPVVAVAEGEADDDARDGDA